MADETKKGCACVAKIKPLLKLLAGLLVILVGFLLTVRYFHSLKIIIVACLGPFLMLVGLIMVAVSRE